MPPSEKKEIRPFPRKAEHDHGEVRYEQKFEGKPVVRDIPDWALLLKTQPHLEKFKPPLPPGCPYELLSIAEILDLHREVMEDMKKYGISSKERKKNRCRGV